MDVSWQFRNQGDVGLSAANSIGLCIYVPTKALLHIAIFLLLLSGYYCVTGLGTRKTHWAGIYATREYVTVNVDLDNL